MLITRCVTIGPVIRSFRDKDTEAIWHRRYVKKLSPELSRLAYNKLVLINAGESINDLRVPPGNRLEKLAGSPRRPVQHPRQRPVAHLLHLECQRRRKRRTRRLPLERTNPWQTSPPRIPGRSF